MQLLLGNKMSSSPSFILLGTNSLLFAESSEADSKMLFFFLFEDFSHKIDYLINIQLFDQFKI